MSTFAAAFRDIVVPDIKRFIQASAPCVGLGVISFAQACDGAERIAARRGSARLPDDVFRQLVDWISDAMLREVEAYERANPIACSNARELWGE